jgi:hypothetical protein
MSPLRTKLMTPLLAASRQQVRRHGHGIPHAARRHKSGAPGPAWVGAVCGAGALTGAFCAALVSLLLAGIGGCG